MHFFLTLLIAVGLGALGFIALNIINIVQAGSKKPDGRTMEQILGFSPEKAQLSDVEKLSRSEQMQLFYAASSPKLNTLNGEYETKLLRGGILGGLTAYFTDHIFPTGKLTLNTKWVGKAFRAEDADHGDGYNIFREDQEGSSKILRIRKITTAIAPTKLGKDGKLSFCLDYSKYNSGLINSMRDEIRVINPQLFIGVGHMRLGGGPLNPAPFVLIGPAKPWVGAK